MTTDTPPVASQEPHAEFLRLFLHAQADIFRYVCALLPCPHDATDVVQETALALWENFDRYDRTRPFVPWALRFALNKARQHAEKTGRLPRLLQDESLLAVLMEEQHAQRTQLNRRHERLHCCLQKLPRNSAELLENYYWKRTPIERLAALGNVSIDAAYKRLQRVRMQLLHCIQRLMTREEADA